MRRLRAGVIGLGVGEQHIAGYESHPACEVVAICDVDEARLAEVGARHPSLRRTLDPDELLSDSGIDVVSIASYDDAHFEQIKSALEHGKHVFAEKPLVLFEEEARSIHALLREHLELRLASNVPLRMSPRFEEIRARIARGDFGTVFHVEGDYDYGRRRKLTEGWRGDLPYYSVVLGGAIHLVDLLLWMTGMRVTEVTSAMSSSIATRGTKFSHPDFVMATLRLDGGATMKITANLGCISPHFHGVRIYGTDATFHNGLPDGVLYADSQPGQSVREERVTSAYPGVRKGDLIHSFIESIVSGASAQVTADDVFRTLEVCFAIERALVSRQNEPVRRLS